MISLVLLMAVPSLPLVMRNWCIENLLFFASSSYNWAVLAAESMVTLSGRDLIGLPADDLLVEFNVCRNFRTHTSWAYLKFYYFARHVGQYWDRMSSTRRFRMVNVGKHRNEIVFAHPDTVSSDRQLVGCM